MERWINIGHSCLRIAKTITHLIKEEVNNRLGKITPVFRNSATFSVHAVFYLRSHTQYKNVIIFHGEFYFKLCFLNLNNPQCIKTHTRFFWATLNSATHECEHVALECHSEWTAMDCNAYIQHLILCCVKTRYRECIRANMPKPYFTESNLSLYSFID